MKKIKCIVVDDEPVAREGVVLLAKADNDLDVVAACSNGIEALSTIIELKPQLLFLDIQMPGINGFELLTSIPDALRPQVIFLTAFDEHTLKAFEVHAIDYILKPFSDQRFYQAVEHAKNSVRQQILMQKQQQLNQLLPAQQSKAGLRKEGGTVLDGPVDGRLAIKTNGKVYLLAYDDIIWIEAYDYYIKFHTQEKYYLVRDSLKRMEQSLPTSHFYRIHKSSIVNMKFVEMLNVHTDELTLKNNTTLKLSRNYRDSFKAKLMHQQ